jgi:perosamine synthetase
LLDERRRLAAAYNGLITIADVARPVEPPGYTHTYQGYVVRMTDGGMARRNRIMDRLAAAGIPTRPGTHAVHRLGYYQDKYNLAAEQFPNACVAEDTSITLPLFPGMTADEQQQVVDTLAAAVAES